VNENPYASPIERCGEGSPLLDGVRGAAAMLAVSFGVCWFVTFVPFCVVHLTRLIGLYTPDSGFWIRSEGLMNAWMLFMLPVAIPCFVLWLTHPRGGLKQ